MRGSILKTSGCMQFARYYRYFIGDYRALWAGVFSLFGANDFLEKMI